MLQLNHYFIDRILNEMNTCKGKIDIILEEK